MTPTVEICNLALSHLGQAAVVESVDPPDESFYAQLCVAFWPAAVDTLLENHAWGWATKTAALSLTTEQRPGWAYCFAAPSDCLRLWTVARDPHCLRQVAYERQAGIVAVTPTVICANEPELYARYTTSELMPQSISPQFKLALSMHLAALLAGPIIKGDQSLAVAKGLLQRAEVYAARAAAADANQQNAPVEHMPEWLGVR